MHIYHISYPIIEKKFFDNILAIGFFDGVHLGHQEVIKRAQKIAKEKNILCSVMTFNPHPLQVIGINKKIDEITPIKTKVRIFEEMKIDICYIVEFTKEFADINPQEFIDDFLMKLSVKGIVIGYDFSFGKEGAGKPEILRKLSNERYSVDIIEQYSDQAKKISSSRIRENLLLGNMKEANRLLGRNFTFKGKVIHGYKRGRILGYPTANIELIENFMSVKSGVYVVRVLYADASYTGVMNIGTKPTFELEDISTIEIHILDFSQEIYGELIEVELLEYIRDEKKFNNIEELKKEINSDIEKARNLLLSLKHK